MQCQHLTRPVKLPKLGFLQHPKIASGFPTNAHISRLGRHMSHQRQSRNNTVNVFSWSFFKKLGLQKPSFLPDFGRAKRQQLLDRFFGGIDRRTYEELLAPNFTMVDESDDSHRKFSKQGKYLVNLVHSLSSSLPTVAI